MQIAREAPVTPATCPQTLNMHLLNLFVEAYHRSSIPKALPQVKFSRLRLSIEPDNCANDIVQLPMIRINSNLRFSFEAFIHSQHVSLYEQAFATLLQYSTCKGEMEKSCLTIYSLCTRG